LYHSNTKDEKKQVFEEKSPRFTVFARAHDARGNPPDDRDTLGDCHGGLRPPRNDIAFPPEMFKKILYFSLKV
jgi:hypothetical protein